METNTVDMERFAAFNIHGFNPIEVCAEILCAALARSAYYLV